MKATKKMLALLGLSALAFAANAVPSVALKSVRQRYPWNNIVDIVYTVTGYSADTDVDGYFVTFDATIPGIDGDIACTAGQMIDGNGDFTVQWDATRDAVIYTDSAKLTMKVYNVANQIKVDSYANADYEIWDLTTDPFTVSYEKVPVLNDEKLQRISNARYLDAEYQTSKLVLRKIPSSSVAYTVPAAKNLDSGKTTIDTGYLIGVYELTIGQISTILKTAGVDLTKYNYGNQNWNDTSSRVAAGSLSFSALFGGSHLRRDTSTISATWNDATAYNQSSGDPARSGAESLLTLMNRLAPSGKAFTLPTDAQWEVASLGGVTADTYWWWRDGTDGNPLCKVTTTYATKDKVPSTGGVSNEELRNYCNSQSFNASTGATANSTRQQSYAITASASAFNPWGLADMYGNVWEWTLDCAATGSGTAYGKATTTSTITGATTTSGSNNAVHRGGSYNYGANYCSSAGRNVGSVPGYVHVSIGARLARVSE